MVGSDHGLMIFYPAVCPGGLWKTMDVLIEDRQSPVLNPKLLVMKEMKQECQPFLS